MNKIKTKLISIIHRKLFGTPVSGVKAYPVIINFKTTYPTNTLDYNNWCEEVRFSSAVVKNNLK